MFAVADHRTIDHRLRSLGSWSRLLLLNFGFDIYCPIVDLVRVSVVGATQIRRPPVEGPIRRRCAD